MTTTVYISIDTEEDLWDDYRVSDNPVQNIQQLPSLQNLFNRYGAKPTYLVNWPVVANDSSCRVLSRLVEGGHCEIGTHLHPWNTPPHREEITPYNTMLSNLSHELVAVKLGMMHQFICDRLGLTPTVFRSGRWGFGTQVADALVAQGYPIDSSVSPFMDWSIYHGPDFSTAPTGAYRFYPDRFLTPDSQGPLLEVPPTIGFFQRPFRLCGLLRKWLAAKPLRHLHLIGLMERLHLMSFRWLSPEFSDAESLIRLARACVRRGTDDLHMMFHSTTLLPGMSPFVANDADLEAFLNRIEAFLHYAAGEGMVFAPLGSASDAHFGNARNRNDLKAQTPVDEPLQ